MIIYAKKKLIWCSVAYTNIQYSMRKKISQINLLIILLSLYNFANKFICQGYSIRENRSNTTDEMSSTFYTANGFRKLVM